MRYIVALASAVASRQVIDAVAVVVVPPGQGTRRHPLISFSFGTDLLKRYHLVET